MLIAGATVVDPEARSLERRDLHVHAGRIAPAWDVAADGEEVVDGTGRWVLPGLVDAHVHVVPFPGASEPFPGLAVAPAVSALREAARAGVTTVRDLGGDLATLLAARRIARQPGFDGSDLLISGPMLTVPFGHGTGTWHGVGLGNMEETRAIVHALCTAGVDQVKLVTSGANGRFQISREVMGAAIEESRTCGRGVAVHAHLQAAQIEAAVDLGARTIEHGFLLHELPATLDRMAAGSTFLCPTLRVVAAVREHPTHFGQRLVPAAWDDALQSVRAAHAAGVAIVAGTDAGIFGVQIADLWRERISWS